MGLKLEENRGYPLDKQLRSWKDIVIEPLSKLDDDAMTRVRQILMNGIETEALRFSHAAHRMNPHIQHELAIIRRVEQHQATTINWLTPPDQSPLETTIAYEQVAIEVTAAVAQREPDPYLAQAYRFGLLEDFDHLYRYSALMDRLEGKDANNILQSYTDILPGRPTMVEHRHPIDDIRTPYEKSAADPLTKLHALILVGGEFQTHDYYMNIGPLFSDPLARQLYAEIASIEEQHVTHYESMCDPTESWMEKWLLHEANEVYNYYSCAEQETNPRIKALWEQFLDYELGHLQVAMEAFKKFEGRDPMQIIPSVFPDPLPYQSNRNYVKSVLAAEVNLSANGTAFVDRSQEHPRSVHYRNQLNASGSPSEAVAANYIWTPGTELNRPKYASKAVHAAKGAMI
ncbi:MAG TPA: hypothetical protein VE954_13680 [Oligoflexus sp.]|uniref:hypothetical protein n=1 Tax=Oligoflexus sp. TaxID=1971216 RepID=UPI002D32677C|nr:hypothetical protein [Oligoflexus sp.]HYX34150.1 hypothetical protein [Oligoflexus sp.]